MENGAINGIEEDVATGYVDGKTKAQPSPNGETVGDKFYKATLKLKEHHVYGVSRLGVKNSDIVIAEPTFLASIDGTTKAFTNIDVFSGFTPTIPDPNKFNRTLGDKRYELSNHLGNVLATISDRKLAEQIPPGRLQVDVTGTLQGTFKPFTGIVGETYTISLDFDPGSSGEVTLYFLENLIFNPQAYILTEGLNTFSFVAGNTNLGFVTENTGGGTTTYYMDNVLMVEQGTGTVIWDDDFMGNLGGWGNYGPSTITNDGSATGKISHYVADVTSRQNYYPFGMQMPGRSFNANSYNYGFQGQMKTDEIYGSGNLYAFEYRMQDPRLGRFWSVDPLAASYPWNSTYAFAENRVIDGIDLEGLEWQPVNAQGENVAPDADNIADYTWVGYDEFAYQNPDGSVSTDPHSEESIKIGVSGPEGTVANAELWTDYSKRVYSSDQYSMSGNFTSVRALTIKVNRVEEDKNQTVSMFEIPQAGAFPIQGNFIEPSGPSTTTSGQNKRIPPDTYEVYKHWRNPPKHQGEYGLTNDDVPSSRAILFHYGKDYNWTRGCLVCTNRATVNKLNAQIKLVGTENVRVIIQENIQP